MAVNYCLKSSTHRHHLVLCIVTGAAVRCLHCSYLHLFLVSNLSVIFSIGMHSQLNGHQVNLPVKDILPLHPEKLFGTVFGIFLLNVKWFSLSFDAFGGIRVHRMFPYTSPILCISTEIIIKYQFASSIRSHRCPSHTEPPQCLFDRWCGMPWRVPLFTLHSSFHYFDREWLLLH